MRVKAKFGIGIGIIVVSLSALAWMGARESKTYYHTVAELSSLDASALRQRIRVGGDVAAGSIQHLPGRVDFVLKDEGKTLPVSYVGPTRCRTRSRTARSAWSKGTPCPTDALSPSKCRPSAPPSTRPRRGRTVPASPQTGNRRERTVARVRSSGNGE